MVKETIKHMTRCLAGIGALLHIGRADAVGAVDGDTCEMKQELMVMETEETDDLFLGRWLFYTGRGDRCGTDYVHIQEDLQLRVEGQG